MGAVALSAQPSPPQTSGYHDLVRVTSSNSQQACPGPRVCTYRHVPRPSPSLPAARLALMHTYERCGLAQPDLPHVHATCAAAMSSLASFQTWAVVLTSRRYSLAR